MANYPIAATTVFKNRSFDDLLRPLAMYTEEFRKVEDASNELATKASIWEGMADQETDPIAYAQYKRYADDLQNQAINLSQNGLNPASRRDLMNLKRRYATEIVPIEQAYKAVEDERKRRRESNDRSLLYATDNIRIDDYLGGKTPNLYNISGNELYTKGAATGKAYSSRIYSSGDGGSTLGGYYRDYVTRLGYNPDKLNTFQREMLMNGFASQVSALPELQEAANQILEANGVYQNLTGDNLVRAQQQVIRGIVDGAVYSEDHKPVRDAGKMSAAEAASNARANAAEARAQEQWNIQKNIMYKQNPDGTWELNPNYIGDNYEVDPNTGKLKKRRESGSTPEQKAALEVQKKEALDRMNNARKVKNVKTVEEADKAGYVPVFTTVHPSHGSSKGMSLQDAIKTKNYSNIEGWRSGPQGTDVPDLYIDWTNAPLIEGSQSSMVDLIQWSSGSHSKPNNGDFSYNISGAQTKMMSDDEYLKLPDAVKVSIEAELRRQGYEDDTPFEVMQVTGRGGKTSYMTFVPKDRQILLGD